MILAVIFDCFGVLTTDTWKSFVDSLPPEIDKDRLRELNRQLDTGLLSHDDFNRQVFEVSGSEPQYVENLLNNEVAKNKMLIRYIRELKQKGLKIGLLSNVSSDWITESFLTSEEVALFDAVILSHHVGLAKPDPRMFELACEKLEQPPEGVVMVDDVEHNCAGAESIGMSAIVYKDFSHFETQMMRLLTDTN